MRIDNISQEFDVTLDWVGSSSLPICYAVPMVGEPVEHVIKVLSAKELDALTSLLAAGVNLYPLLRLTQTESGLFGAGANVAVMLRLCPRDIYCADLTERIRFAEELREQLKKIHAAGWLHRDIKEENIVVEMVDGVSHAYFIDFGSAGRRDSKQVGFFGTLKYAPLSVVNSNSPIVQDEATDFEMLENATAIS